MKSLHNEYKYLIKKQSKKTCDNGHTGLQRTCKNKQMPTLAVLKRLCLFGNSRFEVFKSI